MSDHPPSAPTRDFYERFPFPGTRVVDRDGLILLRHVDAAMKRQRTRRAPERVRVLDAGCGTGNSSVALARRYPDALFTGIDQSQPSLEKALRSASDAGLANVSFRGHDLMDLLPTGEQYDIILCLGVLHHTADMDRGLTVLRNALDEEGDLFLWIYGLYGRFNHSLNVRALQMLLRDVDDKNEATRLATGFARESGDGAPLRDLMGDQHRSEIQREVFSDPIWIADQFLNPLEKLLDLEGLTDLLDRTHFTLSEVLGEELHIERFLKSPELVRLYDRLDARSKRLAADLLTRPTRYFIRARSIAK